MEVVYFAFYNDPKDPLQELKEEDQKINQILEVLAAQGQFRIVRDSFASLDTVAEKLTLYQNDLVLFHFGGHAGQSELLLEDGSARSEGIAQLLKNCPNLQLVFLNGCSTQGQVDRLLELGVPAVLATTRPVNDKKARVFSTHFYQTLSYLKPLDTAVEFAKGKVLALDPGQGFHRSIGRKTAQPAEADSWVFAHQAGREEVLEWNLSMLGGTNLPPDYQPNQQIIDQLLQALAPYRPKVQQILDDEEMDVEHTIMDKRDSILEALPHPIGDQLRWLLAPDIVGQKAVLYDKPGSNRLQQLLRVYDLLIELISFIMLAQLWDELEEKRIAQMPASLQDQIRTFLQIHPEKQAELGRFQLIRNIRLLFDDHEISYFVKELEGLHPLFEEGNSFYEACRFLENNKNAWKNIGQGAAEQLSVMAEEKLAVILRHMGFLANYTFASVKNIDVLKYRHRRQPNYKHTIVKLIMRLGKLGEEPKLLRDVILDKTSVLIIKNFDSENLSYLNLTPFVIDQNAFSEKATIAKLHFFERGVPEQDAYLFRHIYALNDLPLVIAQQKEFKVVKAQFKAFEQLVFSEPLQTTAQ